MGWRFLIKIYEIPQNQGRWINWKKLGICFYGFKMDNIES